MNSVKKFTLAEIESMPILRSGHFDNLKVETETMRTWLSRMTVEDGASYNNQVTVEKLVAGVWTIAQQYEAR